MPCMFVFSTMTSLRQTEGACFFMTFVIPQWEKKRKVVKLQFTHWNISAVRFFMLHISMHSCHTTVHTFEG